ncbi:hypothetical protein TH25_19500 [Thalassospira profundimaris]|uniref:Uncharacterized protein n=1 Tax=Thalassospira profundimaris TaxID=502049 RepID=A0A367WSS7_9PROT|nr:hypothetical protein TH25_19500 [Thalassospira profundimaris]
MNFRPGLLYAVAMALNLHPDFSIFSYSFVKSFTLSGAFYVKHNRYWFRLTVPSKPKMLLIPKQNI